MIAFLDACANDAISWQHFVAQASHNKGINRTHYLNTIEGITNVQPFSTNSDLSSVLVVFVCSKWTRYVIIVHPSSHRAPCDQDNIITVVRAILPIFGPDFLSHLQLRTNSVRNHCFPVLLELNGLSIFGQRGNVEWSMWLFMGLTLTRLSDHLAHLLLRILDEAGMDDCRRRPIPGRERIGSDVLNSRFWKFFSQSSSVSPGYWSGFL